MSEENKLIWKAVVLKGLEIICVVGFLLNGSMMIGGWMHPWIKTALQNQVFGYVFLIIVAIYVVAGINKFLRHSKEYFYGYLIFMVFSCVLFTPLVYSVYIWHNDGTETKVILYKIIASIIILPLLFSAIKQIMRRIARSKWSREYIAGWHEAANLMLGIIITVAIIATTVMVGIIVGS